MGAFQLEIHEGEDEVVLVDGVGCQTGWAGLVWGFCSYCSDSKGVYFG